LSEADEVCSPAIGKYRLILGVAAVQAAAVPFPARNGRELPNSGKRFTGDWLTLIAMKKQTANVYNRSTPPPRDQELGAGLTMRVVPVVIHQTQTA
jgi:hypothetical protein